MNTVRISRPNEAWIYYFHSAQTLLNSFLSAHAAEIQLQILYVTLCTTFIPFYLEIVSSNSWKANDIDGRFHCINILFEKDKIKYLIGESIGGFVRLTRSMRKI